MKIIDHVLLKQPELIEPLLNMGFRPLEIDAADDEPDANFSFFDRLMRQVPRRGKE